MALARSAAACRDVHGASAACCTALQGLRCMGCDGAAQLGIVTAVSPAACEGALAACAGDAFAADAAAGTALCSDSDVLCASAVDTFGSDARGAAAFCSALGFAVAGGLEEREGGAGGGGSSGSLEALRAEGYTRFPSALHPDTVAGIERAIARAAREAAAAAEAESAAEAEAAAAAGAARLGRALLAVAGEPLAITLLALALGGAFLMRTRIRAQLSAWSRAGGCAAARGARLSASDLRALRARVFAPPSAREGGGVCPTPPSSDSD